MLLHMIFLSFQRTNWDDYLEHLRADLETLVCRLPLASTLFVKPNCMSRTRLRISPGLVWAVTASIQTRISLFGLKIARSCNAFSGSLLRRRRLLRATSAY